MKIVRELVLQNFKRFEKLSLRFDSELNILSGENESGKSTILQALDLVMTASRNKVEALGLESLFNADCINKFLAGPQRMDALPKMYIELYLEGVAHHELNGRNNSKGAMRDGMKMVCAPVEDFLPHIKEVLEAGSGNFPFEYYEVSFQTFTDETIAPQRRPLKSVLIDSSQISNEYAAREYTRSMYSARATPLQRNRHGFEYRQAKAQFRDAVLSDVNDASQAYKFDVRTSPRSSLETDIIITEDDIPIESKGRGRQCFIKTEFALQDREHALDVLLLEEPENHLSHGHMHKLIERIKSSIKKQLFIATHSSLIATRLGLKKVILLSGEQSTPPVKLDELTPDTAQFFMKAPDNNILELALCKRAILVEGDAEFILMDALYKSCVPGGSTEQDGVHVLSVDGTSFKRYLELAKLLGVRVAAIRDNDGDHPANCVENYAAHITDSIRVFGDPNNARDTFEVCIYQDNQSICEDEFSPGRRSLSVQDYMLKNKTDAAFALLEKRASELKAPLYIQQAIQWVRQ